MDLYFYKLEKNNHYYTEQNAKQETIWEPNGSSH